MQGAFTGATQTRRGLFVEANGGTLLLDEIGDMPLALQAKLLRVLETGEVRSVGSDAPRTTDVRIIAATHRDLPAQVRAGTFQAGPVLPAERRADRDPGAARAARGHPAPARAFPDEEPRAVSADSRDRRSRPTRSRFSSTTPGPGTSASSRTWSTAA